MLEIKVLFNRSWLRMVFMHAWEVKIFPLKEELQEKKPLKVLFSSWCKSILLSVWRLCFSLTPETASTQGTVVVTLIFAYALGSGDSLCVMRQLILC